MRSAKRISIIVAALAVFATVFGQSGDFTTKGRVLVAGQPLAMATVTYLNVAKRLSWDFSLANGTFGGAIVSTKNPLPQDATVFLPSEGRVSIDIFEMSGKLAGTASGMLDKGAYTLRPLSEKLAQSMYTLRIRVGNIVTYQKMLNAGFNNAGYTISLSSKREPLVMAKKLAAIDSIRVGKTGYTPMVVPITTYTDDVGDVTLTPVDIEGHVTTLLNSMTQLQRAGQLAMPDYSGVSSGAMVSNNVGCIMGAGGVFNFGTSLSSIADNVDAIQTALMASSIKIPALFACDFVHGASALPNATYFPHNLAMGAIQDTLLIQKAFRVQALEVRGSGCNWGYGPCIAVIRDDRWGRAYEGFCETPDRTMIMARHAVLGLQTSDLSNPMAYPACCKHFAGDGNTVNGVNQGTTVGPDSTARAINLPGYASAVAAGTATIMPSFSSWCDNTPMHQNKILMTGWLKSSAGGQPAGSPPAPNFQGFIVGDYEAGWPLPTCMEAGLDVPMALSTAIISTNAPDNFMNMYPTHAARLDDACKRVLRVKCWMNLFDQKNYITDRRLTALIGCAAHRDVARACVRASQVLLKNANNVLPMPKTANLAIWGNAGDNVGIQCGGWTVSWQGQDGNIPGATSIRTGCNAVDNTVSYVASPTGAGTSDYVLAVLSEEPYAETSFGAIALTGDKASGSNQNVINQIAAAHTAGKKVIGMLIAGRVLDITSIIDNCDAFIWSGLPGSEGEGVADVLFGDYKFTGKLPVTWPMNLAQEGINYGDGKVGRFAYQYGLTD